MIVRRIKDDTLCHYGVKGMKWDKHIKAKKDEASELGKFRENDPKINHKPTAKSDSDIAYVAKKWTDSVNKKSTSKNTSSEEIKPKRPIPLPSGDKWQKNANPKPTIKQKAIAKAHQIKGVNDEINTYHSKAELKKRLELKDGKENMDPRLSEKQQRFEDWTRKQRQMEKQASILNRADNPKNPYKEKRKELINNDIAKSQENRAKVEHKKTTKDLTVKQTIAKNVTSQSKARNIPMSEARKEIKKQQRGYDNAKNAIKKIGNSGMPTSVRKNIRKVRATF